MNTIKSATVESNKRQLPSGEIYTPVEIKNPSSAMKACLDVFMSHSVDFFAIMLDIIADKYGHSKDEMTDIIRKDPRFQNMSVNPMIHSLGYFEQDDLDKAFAKLSVAEKPKTVIVKRVRRVVGSPVEEVPVAVAVVAAPQPQVVKKNHLRTR